MFTVEIVHATLFLKTKFLWTHLRLPWSCPFLSVTTFGKSNSVLVRYIVTVQAHCEDLCLSGGSHTNSTGPTHNPHVYGRSAGGSSSGSAALVGSDAENVDGAIGGDQGGSIRIPASYCGIVGMKATFGMNVNNLP